MRCENRFPRRVLSSVLALGSCILVVGCGAKSKSTDSRADDNAIKTPATVAQAASVLDLTTFPLIAGAKPPWPRGTASLMYAAPGDTKAGFEFHRKELTAKGWKELPNSSVTPESASGMFAGHGFVLSVSVTPDAKNGTVAMMLRNMGNIPPGRLPVPPGVKSVYVGDAAAMYVSDASVPETAEACRKLFLAQGWVPYGGAGDSVYYKQNAILVTATVSAAPAQGGKTMISYNCEQLSADLPALPEAEDLRYNDDNMELSFVTTTEKDAVVSAYRETLTKTGWQPTLDHVVEIDGKDEMIFRNPAKDMITLALARDRRGKHPVEVSFRNAATMAEMDRQIKEKAPELRAAMEAKQAEEAARRAEANKPPPKVAIAIPSDAQDVSESKDAIKFNVGNGKAKAVAENWQKQFKADGWKEDFATLDAMAGAISLSKDNQSLTISYTDTGMMPADVSISAMRAELERK